MNPQTLNSAALWLLALAAAIVGIGIGIGAVRQAQRQRNLQHQLDAREAASEAAVEPLPEPASGWLDRMAATAVPWLESGFAKQLVAAEDRQLLSQCGINHGRSQALFMLARVVCAVLLPVIAALTLDRAGRWYFIQLAMAFALGFMLPKWWLRRKARQRREQVATEVPLMIDLLRLLQGVGLSVDQGLHTIEREFQTVLPVLGSELELANRHYSAGRSREQSLNRVANLYDNEDLRSIVRMLVQVDRHGGAVQEPLRQFADRVRERRRMDMKEKIGKLTVKMTGVMVLTLLPALLIVTAGSGFLAVFRALGSMGQ